LTVLALIVIVGLLWPKTYRSTVTLEFHLLGSRGSLGSSVPDHYDAWRRNTLSHDYLQSVLERFQLFPKLPISQRIQRTEHAVEFAPTRSRDSFAIEVGFEYGNPAIAQKVTADIVDQVLRSNQSYNDKHFPQVRCPSMAVCDFSGFELMDAPPLPRSPEWPNMLTFFSLGCGLGLVAGIVSFVRHAERR